MRLAASPAACLLFEELQHLSPTPALALYTPCSSNRDKPRLHVKIADFGLSCMLGPAKTLAVSRVTNPRWSAPEVIRESAVSTSSDVFSFAVVMWELLTWQQPYEDMMSVQVRMLLGACRGVAEAALGLAHLVVLHGAAELLRASRSLQYLSYLHACTAFTPS